MTPKLSLIIVNYRSSDALEHCLRSLNVATDASLEIILVDNSPDDGAKQVLATSGFHGHYFPQPQNIGFSRAANFGARHASGEILCFVHPDVLFEAGSIDQMVAWVEQHPRSIVGPRQRDPNGKILTSSWPFTDRRAIWGPAEHQGSPWPRASHPYLPWLHSPFQFAYHNRTAKEAQLVPTLANSCMVMPRRVWEEVGGFNEALSYVGLESEWFTRAKELGMIAWYLPGAVVFHEQAVSINRAEGWKVRELTDHDRMWYAKRFGWLAVVVLVAMLWLERKFRSHDAA